MESCNFEVPISYYDKRFSIDAVKLLPGQYFVTTQDKMLVTVLGSCVAACLYDPETGIGGMNHFMLPTVNKTASEFEKTQGMAAKYGVHAMEILINDLVKAGANKARIKAKVFGGGKVVPSFVQHDVGNAGLGLVAAAPSTRMPHLNIYSTRRRRVNTKARSGVWVRESCRHRTYSIGTFSTFV